MGVKSNYTIKELELFSIGITLYIKIEAKCTGWNKYMGDNFNGWLKWSLLKLQDSSFHKMDNAGSQ